ncbi:MAG TPA: aspartate kinase [Pyrinomonadaceae bacterium]
MTSSIKVLKFGGTSVADGAAFERAARIVHDCDVPVVVVVSAMSGVTDALIKSIRMATSDGTAAAIATLEKHFARHLHVAEGLRPEALAKCRTLIENARHEITALLTLGPGDLRTQDVITSYGEILCASLFSLILEHYGIAASYVDARRCILTNDEHGDANPLIHETNLRTGIELKPLLEAKMVPVLGGFIGATARGVTTTLGRGSSDYTATLIGAALQAAEIQIWTDVDGVQTANPNLVTATRTVAMLSYEEAKELAALGARVMHPKMIDPVIEANIPIWIRNSRVPEQSGTLICAQSGPPNGIVKAIAHSARVVACVGDGLSNGTQGAARVRQVLREMDPALKWQSTSASNLITVVDADRVATLVRRLHERLFESQSVFQTA